MSEHVTEHLSAYLDGELSAAEQDRFRAHLTECASCSKRLEELAAVDTRVRDLPVAAPEGYFEALPARVRARLSASAPRRRALSVPLWTLAAAAALLVGVLAPLTLRERRAATSGEVDKLARTSRLKDEIATAAPQRRDAAPPASLAAAPVPAASAAPDEMVQKQAEPKAGALAKARADAPASQPATAPAAPVPRQETAASEASGFAAPPRPAAPATQEFGPRASQQAELRAQAQKKQSADTQAETPAAEGRVAVRALETKDKETPRDAAEARSLRESWRRLAGERTDPREADEARVRVVEMGVAAWRFENQPEDRSLAEQDAAAYLARADARQTDRVRSLLAPLSR